MGSEQLTEILRVVRSTKPPRVTVVLPVFNQETLVGRVLESLSRCMSGDWELIVIDDSSEDKSLESILTACRNLPWGDQLCSIKVFQSKSQLFETACDDYGFSIAEAPVIIELQADMVIEDPGFDRRLEMIFIEFPDALLISGRGVETFQQAYSDFISKGGATVSRGSTPALHLINTGFAILTRPIKHLFSFPRAASIPPEHETLSIVLPTQEEFKSLGMAGRLGKLIDEEIDSRVGHRMVWFGDTVMRGPLAIRRSSLESIGGLDATSFFLGYDDHDLCLRAAYAGLKVGFHPVGFSSPESWGASRKRRTLASEVAIMQQRLRVRRKLVTGQTWRSAVSGSFPKTNWEVRGF